ncbi:WD repeat-containing protein 97-like [Dipodomys merriami]|uniref:WD repeat-containing protein 97-like n=1 Tax=Dipodomys merriami TaxID=94247 RepID=UPI0038559B2A
MEAESLDASRSYKAEVGDLIPDSDLYDADVYDVPVAGLLSEKSESWSSEPGVPQLRLRSRRGRARSLRARHLWLTLRAQLREAVEKEKKEEMQVARLAHGLEPLRHLEVAAGLCSVAQDKAARRFVVLDRAGWLHLHTRDGWAQGKLQAPVPLAGLVAVPPPLGAVGRFIGWGPAALAILRPDLSLLWLSHSHVDGALGSEPTCCLPVPSLGLLLVVEVGGSLTLWKFRSGGRRLVPHRSPLQLPQSLSETFRRLALGPPDLHSQYCFAVYGSTVLTFDLDAWALVNVCQNLHKTTILDLVYCKEIRAVVTASRDSTVKVWEADWQIRMVFVGHTGPVTAMALLPNTSLLLSASQDRTLRTWNLQTAEQVGEAALDHWGREEHAEPADCLLPPIGPGWPVLSLCPTGVDLWILRDLYSPLAQLPAPVLHLQVAPTLPAPSQPPLPMRLVCACADGLVCLVSVVTGRMVSALPLGPEDRAAAVAYCLPREALWLLTHEGHLIRANAARSPMEVLHRHHPPPRPAPQPCALHLYSHLLDAAGAATCWETVRQHRGDMSCGAVTWAWRNKNRYLPVLGHTDGTLSVLHLRTSKTVFRTEAHSPGPVTAIASTWNSIVSSGGDLTVKMWRVFPYAEESLSLLRIFSCCHPAVVLCALGKRITVGFEDPESATYGLVQYGLADSPRCDHQPQDDPQDHITGLCCCPTLKLYACSSLDRTIRIWTGENQLLRLLQLDSAPQALAFCSDGGDLVLALGSRLCLVSHSLYLPTSYLVKKLCQMSPSVVDDPPLPLSSQQSLTDAQLQTLSDLQEKASLSAALSFIHLQTPTLEQPVSKEDLQALLARDKDLQQLQRGLLASAAQPPLSLKQQQEAFNNYLCLIYGRGLAGMLSRKEDHQKDTLDTTMARELEDKYTTARAASCAKQSAVSSESQTLPTPPVPQALGALDQRSAHPPPVSLPIPPVGQRVHSKASELLARSSLSCVLGLSLDLQLKSDKLQGKMTTVVGVPPSPQQKAPRLPHKRRKESLSKLKGFFPATTEPYKRHPRPISFPGYVPNSVVLQRMWLSEEVTMAHLVSDRLKSSLYSQWLRHHRHSQNRWRRRLAHWLCSILTGNEEEEEEESRDWEEDQDKLKFDWSSPSLDQKQRTSGKPKTSPDLSLRPRGFTKEPKTSLPHRHSQHHQEYSPWEQRYGHLPKFLQFLVMQNWFKKLFPNFTLEAYPEMGTVEGLASVLVNLLLEASWEDRVKILLSLARLLPDVTGRFRERLRKVLLHLLNLDPPPGFEDQMQKQFVVLALQLLLACSEDCRDVVVELMSYLLWSPARYLPEVKELLHRLGLQDPKDLLYVEMLTWVRNQDIRSKAVVRTYCCQKLDDITQQLEELVPPSVQEAGILRVVPQVSAQLSPAEQAMPDPEQEFWRMLLQFRAGPTRKELSEVLQAFCSVPMPAASVLLELPSVLLPLEKTLWACARKLNMGPINVLSLFCQQQWMQLQSTTQEAALQPPLPASPADQLVPNTVVRPPRARWFHPILRLQETSPQSLGMRLRGSFCPHHTRKLDGSIRVLKLPLPRIDLQPFPPGWPNPPRALPPLLLQPTLQRYFLPEDADPDSYQ